MTLMFSTFLYMFMKTALSILLALLEITCIAALVPGLEGKVPRRVVQSHAQMTKEYQHTMAYERHG